jgi:hypothetical protein
MSVIGPPDYGAPLFDQAATLLRNAGHEAVNPAEMDRVDCGSVEAAAVDPGPRYLVDLEAITKVDGIALLPGWEKSHVGVPLELLWTIRFCKKPAYEIDMKTGVLAPVDVDIRIGRKLDSVALEASDIVAGARRFAYGHPADNFRVIGRLWMAYLREAMEMRAKKAGKPGLGDAAADLLEAFFDPVTDVANMMIGVKQARLLNSNQRDSWTDICGYAEAGYQGTVELARREAAK